LITIDYKKDRPLRAPINSIVNNPSLTNTQLLNFSSSDDRTRQYLQFRLLLNEAFEGNRLALIEAFIADERAGVFHRPEYIQLALISGLSNDSFEFYLDIAKEFSEWQNYRSAASPQLPVYPIAAVSVFVQTHVLNGYSKGRLVESITLGPEEEVEIEVFHFDKTDTEVEETRATEVELKSEKTNTRSMNFEFSQDVENTVGASVGGDLGLSLPVKAVNVDVGVAGSVSSQITTQNANTANQLSEAVNSASERFKATHQIKTLSRRSSGNETRTTRTFKNPNLGRTLNLHNFELYANYEVKTIVDDTPRLALIVENPEIGPFERDWIRANHHFIDSVLLHDIYRDGFKAAQVLAAQEWIDELAAAEKRVREEQQQRLATQIDTTGGTNYFPNKGIFATARRLKKILQHFVSLGNVDDALGDIARHVNPFDPGLTAQALIDAEDLISNWAWWTQFTTAYPGTKNSAEEFIASIEQAESDPNNQNVADNVIVAVGTFVEKFDDDWIVSLKTFSATFLLGLLTASSAATALAVPYLWKLILLPNDKGLAKLISVARADYAQHKAKHSAEALTPPSPSAENLVASDMPLPPPRGYTEKELAEAHASLNRLVLHLNEEKVYYTNAYYKQENSALRIDRLSDIGVAPFVENRLLGFSGRSAIYPLRLSSLPSDVKTFAEELVSKKPEDGENSVPEKVVKITIPSGGYVSEAALGTCDVLEPYLQDRREIEKRAAVAQAELLELSVKEKMAAIDRDGD